MVKALNTMNCQVMVDPGRVPGEHNAFLCGNDDTAKAAAAELITSFGWPAGSVIDLGDISAARGTEMLLPLWLRLTGAFGYADFNFHIAHAWPIRHARIPRPPRSVMDAQKLRALQQPLKDAYRSDPESAVITLRARGELGAEEVSCSVETGQALAVAGLHPASGGDGTLACSGDMLLQALVACAGVTLRAVATSLGVPVAGGTVRAEGDLDFRGTLAVAKEAPVGFTAIRLSFDLDTDASQDQLDTLLRLTERYCVVFQTLARPAQLSASLTATGP